MPCCNQKRTALRRPETTASPNEPAPPAEIFFRYTGLNRIVVYGAVTRIAYRFDSPGASRAIDRRDAPGMMAVPMLERVA